MGVSIIFSGLVVAVILAKRCELLEPFIDVLNQAGLVVVDINGRRNMHGRYEGQPFLYSTFFHRRFYLRSDVYVVPMLLCMEF